MPYETENQKQARISHEKAVDAQVAGVFALIKLVALIVPILLAKAFSYVWGIFFKLGVAGRVLQSVVAGFVLGALSFALGLGKAFEFLGLVGNTTVGMVIAVIVVLGIFALVTLLYFYLIYPVYSRMEVGEFSDRVTSSFKIMWFGLLGGMVLGALVNAGVLPGLKEYGAIVRNIIIFGSLIVGVVVFVTQSLPYIQEAIEGRKEAPKQTIAAIISVVIVCGSIGFLVVQSKAEEKTRESKLQSNYQVGATFRATQKDKLYEEADKKSAVTKEINVYDELTVTGNFVFEQGSSSYMYVPVEHNGVKGWILTTKYATPAVIKGTAAIIADDVYYHEGTSGRKEFIPIGSKVEVISISRNKKTNEQAASVFYKGRYLGIYGEGIKLDE